MRDTMKKLILVIVFLLYSATGLFSEADAITFDFSGTLNDDFGSVSAGTGFTGFFTYDEFQTPQFNVVYGLDKLSVSVGVETAVSKKPSSSSVAVFLHIYDDNTPENPYSNLGWDAIHVKGSNAETSGSIGGVSVSEIELLLIDSTGSTLTDLSAPTSINLVDFDTARFDIQHGQGVDSFKAFGTITGIGVSQTGGTPDPIPEPITMLLLGIGLAGLVGVEVRRRRKKKAVDKS